MRGLVRHMPSKVISPWNLVYDEQIVVAMVVRFREDVDVCRGASHSGWRRELVVGMRGRAQAGETG